MNSTRCGVLMMLMLAGVGCHGRAARFRPKVPADAARPGLSSEALDVHFSGILIDGHNDLPWAIRAEGDGSFEQKDIAQPQAEFHTDIPRLKAGGLDAQFWSAWVPPETMRTGGATRTALEQIDLIHRMVDRYPAAFEFAETADDIERIVADGKIACLIGVEGGHTIENSLGVLRRFYDLGVRYLTLTHTETIDWADSSTDEAKHGGLTSFGEEVVREMNRLGMLVDVSHVSDETMKDVLRITASPIIASHSSAYALAEHPRNVSDELLRQVAANGGLVMVNFFSGFVEPQAAKITQNMFQVLRDLRAQHPDDAGYHAALNELREKNPLPRGTVAMVADHIDHMVAVAGIDHVGIGSDFDGVSQLPDNLDDVSYYPYLTQELLNRGYQRGQIHKILGGNVLRVMRRVEDVAARLAKTVPPSLAKAIPSELEPDAK